MTDSRRAENPIPTTEVLPKPVVVRETFSFFDNPVSSSDDSIMQTSDIKYPQSESTSGALIGTARTLDGSRIKGNDLLRISFEIRTSSKTEGEAPLTGQELENPAILMETPSGVFASKGDEKIDGNNRKLTFTQWIKVQQTGDITKQNIAAHFKKFEAQPRSIALKDLPKSKFRII